MRNFQKRQLLDIVDELHMLHRRIVRLIKEVKVQI